ncbi:hypothetical protein RJ53_07190 [Methanocalculus chunghsingensis]|uniref:Uncharacterized protein n=1 Tax=Methanocalculus chunghsingensis TaxID=156457 RepID=A0A8J7WAC0_9EURY|nr:fibrillarin-like rRNA/tRNA 2'-O-methyltransferase [Methanocalculus chunghsingensis]MBR1369287.1 hypothetical protein [Methanocalculus chunghsingensis]
MALRLFCPSHIRHIPFLKAGGTAFLMLKTRSVDIRQTPEAVFAETIERFIDSELRVVTSCWLEPYHHDHAAIVCEHDASSR